MCNGYNHPPGCTCGYGGEGHLGRSYGYHGADGTSGYTSSGDFCRPTKCHYCGAEIFFVRHNNGSVWFDSLGNPWPKHKCYYVNHVTSNADKEVQKGIDKWLQRLANPLIGVVTDTKFNREANAKYAIVKCSDGTEQTLRVYITFSVDGFVGEMVIFSKKDGILIRPFLNLETIIPLQPPPPPVRRLRYKV